MNEKDWRPRMGWAIALGLISYVILVGLIAMHA